MALTAHLGSMIRSGWSMEILGLKIPLFLDFVKTRKIFIYLREREGEKLNGQVKKVQFS